MFSVNLIQKSKHVATHNSIHVDRPVFEVFRKQLLFGPESAIQTSLGIFRLFHWTSYSNVDVGAQELHQNRALSLAEVSYNIAIKRHNDFWFSM